MKRLFTWRGVAQVREVECGFEAVCGSAWYFEADAIPVQKRVTLHHFFVASTRGVVSQKLIIPLEEDSCTLIKFESGMNNGLLLVNISLHNVVQD